MTRANISQRLKLLERETGAIAAPLDPTTDRFAVVFTEPRNGLEVRCKAACKPLAFKAAARLNTVQVTVDIDLEHHLGVIRRPTGQCWFDAFKPKLMQIKLIDKDINYAHGIGVRHVVIEGFREEKSLRTIVALNEPLSLPPKNESLAEQLNSSKEKNDDR
ncbi:hypothetical protein OKW37_005312 [Paraburkholderia sp. MM5482-R2]